MSKEDKTVETAASAVVLVLGWIVIATSLLICLEVLCRNLLGFSFQGVDEITGYVMATISAWGFAYAVVSRSHIRIDSLIQFARGRLRAGLDILCYLGLTWMGGMLTFHGFKTFQFSFAFQSRSQTPLSTPMWIPQLLWVAGLAAFTLVSAFVCLRATRLWLSSGADEVISYLNREETQEVIDSAIADQKNKKQG